MTKLVIWGLGALFCIFTTELGLAASNSLAKRDQSNVIGLSMLGFKNFKNPHNPLNKAGQKTLPSDSCFNTFYHFFFTNYLALGLDLDACINTVEDSSPGTPLNDIFKSTRNTSLQAIIGLPLKQRLLDGPFARQVFEIGFILSYGSSILSFEASAVNNKSYIESVTGTVQAVSFYLDFGSPGFGIRSTMSYQEYIYPKFKQLPAAINTVKLINASQNSLNINLGVRYSF
ncbi:MAG: hypothetical protein JJV97_04035 [SAR324 cluster bacterium]|nr:hypothetical protein [SAR324 cluster bacterium]